VGYFAGITARLASADAERGSPTITDRSLTSHPWEPAMPEEVAITRVIDPSRDRLAVLLAESWVSVYRRVGRLVDEGECGPGACMERGVRGHEAGAAGLGGRGEVEAVLDGVPDRKGDGLGGGDPRRSESYHVLFPCRILRLSRERSR
jgi:hypothetical protein